MPDVVRADGEVVVLAVGCNGCADEAVLRGVGGGGFGWSGGERGLEERAALFGFFEAGPVKMVERGGDGFEIGTDWGAGMGGGMDRDRHGGGM